MSTSTQSPVGKIGVGVAAIVTNSKGQILVGKRKGSHGAGTWQLPGGHLEFQEDVLVCAARETAEETGLHVKGMRIKATTNDIFYDEQKHYITIFVECIMLDPGEEPQLLEPNKCEGWHWRTWHDLRLIKDSGQASGEKLFLPLVNLLQQTPNLDQLASS